MSFSSEIKLFVRRYIGSMQQLEVLLVLASEPEREWTAEEIGKKVELHITAVTNRLLSLCVKGLACTEEKMFRTFRYCGDAIISDNAINELRSIHKEQPSKLIELIYSKTEKLRDFSDAFRLKQDDEND